MTNRCRQADHPSLEVIYDLSAYDVMNGSTGRRNERLQSVGVLNTGHLRLTDTDGTVRDGGFRGWARVDAGEIPDPDDACLRAKRMKDAAAGSSRAVARPIRLPLLCSLLSQCPRRPPIT